MTEAMTELKPCPFCGGPATLSQENDYHTGKPKPYKWVVECKPCDCSTDRGFWVEREAAISAWNTRPSDELVEAVALRDEAMKRGLSHSDIIEQLGCWLFDAIRGEKQ